MSFVRLRANPKQVRVAVRRSPKGWLVTVTFRGEAAVCSTCAKQPHEVNHPPGMIFVGWGRGWERCPDCKGTARITVADPIECEARSAQRALFKALRQAETAGMPGIDLGLGGAYEHPWKEERK